jgi:hypothetical protein
VGNVLAALAVAATIVALQIAQWTSEKDFREVCENYQVGVITIFGLIGLLTGSLNYRL